MDTGTRDAAHSTPESQAAMLRALGYAGVDHSGLGGLAEFCTTLDNSDLKLFAVYSGLSIDGDADPAAHDAAFTAIRDRGVCLWLPLTSRSVPPSSPAGDSLAVPLVRQLGEKAAACGVRIAIYPHTGFWAERVEDAARVAAKVDLPNVGATFNLCHFLRVAGDQDLYATLAAAAPQLFLATVNGADAGSSDWQGLIQTLDRGTHDVYDVLVALREFGYAGPVGLQGYGIGGDAEDNLRRSMTAWRTLGERYAAEWKSLVANGLTDWREPRGEWADAGEAAIDPAAPARLAWQEGKGVLVNGPNGRTSDLFSTAEHGDLEAHLEFMVPKSSNSGVYFQGRYEVQILDSFGVEAPTHGDCGGIYERWDDRRQPPGYEGHPPRVNASRPPGEWQSFDVVFRAPRFAPDGVKVANARFVRVWHNGVLAHQDVEVTGPTRAAAFVDERPTGPLMLQGDHGPVAYRGIRLRPLRTTVDAWLAGLLPAGALRELCAYRAGSSRLAWARLEDRLRAVPPDLRALLECRLVALLREAETTTDARREGCRLLGRWGTSRAVPALAELLRSPECAHLAASALAGLEAAEAGAALAEALPGLEGPVAAVVVAALGRRGDVATVPLVAARLADPDPGVRRAALSALGSLASPPAAEVLRTAQLPPELQSLRDDGLLRCAEADLAAGRTAEASQAFRELYAATPPGPLRLAALTGLARAGGEATLPDVLAALRSPEAPLRQAAARATLSVPGATATTAFAKVLPELAEETQIALIHALAERGDPAAAAAIGAACALPSSPVRQAACIALETLGDGSHVPALVRLAATGDDANAQAARQALERLPGKGAEAALASLLADQAPATRALVCRVVAARRAPDAFAALLGAVDDADEGVRREAWRGLAQVSGPERFPVLIDLLLAQPDAGRGDLAAQAIQTVAERTADGARVGELLLAALPRASAEVRPQFLRLLGRFGGAKALGTLSAAARSQDPAVREPAIRALAQWPDPTPLATLAEIATSDTDPVRKTLAWRGSVRLLGLATDLPREERLRRLREALATAPQPDERRQVLAVLPSLPDPETLALAGEFLADPVLGPEARPSFLRLARWLAGTNQPGVREAIAAAQRDPAAGDDAFRQALQQALAEASALVGRIALWDLAGPYAAAGQDAFATAWPPEQAGAAVRWQPVGALDGPWTSFIKAGDINLGALLGGENCAAYLRAGVQSPTAQDVVLELGSDDGVKVWLNRALVHANDARRATHLGDDQAKAHLEPGWNALLVKVTQATGEWGLALRLRTPAGEPLAGLVSRPE
jgi:HEAT repeat protein/sugar phosphate isomerase/epimerase